MWLLPLALIAGPSAAAFLVARLVPPSTSYDTIQKPSWSPAPLVFPIVWTVLYLLMGYASYRVASRTGLITTAMGLYAAQLLLNIAWTPVFFGLSAYTAALWMIRGIMALVILTMIAFADVDTTSTLIMIPYLAWLGVAHQLNQGIVDLN
jgi:tryptophan-rich sensory protein